MIQFTKLSRRGAEETRWLPGTATLVAEPLGTGDLTSDRDGDGADDTLESCLQTPDADQTDTDGDGVGDGCDDRSQIPNADQADADGSEAGDACLVTPGGGAPLGPKPPQAPRSTGTGAPSVGP